MTFLALADRVLAGYFRLNPVHATEIGEHAYDGEWPDLSEMGRQERIAWVHDAMHLVEATDPAALDREVTIDRRVLLAYLDAMRFELEELREGSWNPLRYVYLFGGGLFSLLARDFAPLEERLRSAASRMRGLPTALDQAREALGAAGERPVSRFHAEKAVERMGGITDLCRTAVHEAEQNADPQLLVEVRDAAQAAEGAIERFTTWLRDELLPRTDGDFRLGAELYAAKFRHALKSEMTPEQLEQRAAKGYDEVRAEMVRLARALWPEWGGGAPMPDDEGQLVRTVLDAIAAEHPPAEALLDYCRDETARIGEFVRTQNLVGLPDEPMQIVWTPEFLRAFGGAMLIPPGPLDRDLDAFFAITPMPADWSDDRKESYLREDNDRMLRLLTIHEAVPGHYLQLAWSNRCSSLVRTAFQSGVFAEGWAVFVTQVMMDAGYGSEDPALMLVHWKFYLRSITNALMDIRIHAGSMDEAEAMRLMVEGGFQEQGEAANKWDRARLSSTQLCEYFLGSVEMHELEAEARRRASAGGEEFVYRPFLESVIGHGTPPMPVIRDLLFDD
jgi:uncharacterized protein (DUF885 family)